MKKNNGTYVIWSICLIYLVLIIVENQFAPEFTETTYSVVLSPDFSDVIDKVKAFDKDQQHCESTLDCKCAKIMYKIESGNSDSMFQIDTSTGDITYTPNIVKYSDASVKLRLVAYNDWVGYNSKETTTYLTVMFDKESGSTLLSNSIVGNLKENHVEVHHRSKRAAVSV